MKTEVKSLPNAVVLYGVPGIGKTSFAAFIPGVVFMTDDKEEGISTLKAAGLVPRVPQLPPVSSWQDAVEMLESLAEGEHDYKTLALDTLGGFERLCHEFVCVRDFGGDWTDRGFMGFMRGYELALGEWRRFLNLLDRLRRERSMSVVFLGHAKVAPYNNPSGPNYDRYTADVHHKTWSITHKWADMVLFASYDVAFGKGDDGKQKAKARGGTTRTIYTEYEATFDAKNRHNLPTTIDMGSSGREAWANLIGAVRAGKQQQPTSVPTPTNLTDEQKGSEQS